MPKLYFKYGAMGCSKSAQALMCKFNYEQKNFKVLLAKPDVDTRDGAFIKSRIGLCAPCKFFKKEENLLHFFNSQPTKYDVVIIDECQFCSAKQIEQLKQVANLVPVLCYGLKTNFKSFLFEGSKRLLEIADSISEIKSICKCGAKATINARLVDGKVVHDGEEVLLGTDDKYEAMCYNCWKNYNN